MLADLAAQLADWWLWVMSGDHLAAFLFGASIILALVISLFASRLPGGGHLFALLTLFYVCAWLGLSSNNAVVFYLGWEIAALSAWAIGQLESVNGGPAALPTQLAGAVGSILMIVSLFALASANGTLDLGAARGDGLEWVSVALLVALLLKSLVLVGYAWREGRQQLAWAGAAFQVTGGVFIVGVYPFGRLLLGTFGGMQFSYWREAAVWLGLSLAVLGALAALGEDDAKRSAASGALSQILALFALLAIPSARGLAGTLLLAFAYAGGIAALFLSLGLAEAATGERRLAKLGGLGAAMPGAAFACAAAGLCLAGVPPLGAFVGQTLVVSALVQLGSPWPAVLYGLLWLLTVLYVLRLFRGVFLGQRSALGCGRLTVSARVGLACAALLAFAYGLLPLYSRGLVEPIVGQLMR